MVVRKSINELLDRLACAQASAQDRPWMRYSFWVHSGTFLGVVLAVCLALITPISLPLMSAVLATAVLAVVALERSLRQKTQRVVAYHYLLASLSAASALLWFVDQPLLPYLDVLVLAFGMAQSVGRIGCFQTGCCHGIPHSWGVRYRKDEVAASPGHYMAGIRLFPIQAIESLWLFIVVAAGLKIILSGDAPGDVLSWYLIAYGTGRFLIESGRGDQDRLFVWGFSGAQWTSLFLIYAVIWAELSGSLVFHFWHVGTAVLLPTLMITVTLRRHLSSPISRQLLEPSHIREFTELLDWISLLAWKNGAPPQGSVPTGTYSGFTTLGIRLSAGRIGNSPNGDFEYLLCSQDRVMREEIARAFADLIVRRRHAAGPYKLLETDPGVFHVTVVPGFGTEEDDSSENRPVSHYY